MSKMVGLVALGTVVLFFGSTANGVAQTSDLTTAMTRAYNANPALLAERAGLGAANEQVPQALSGWRPTVNVRARFNREYSDSVTAFTFSAGENTINSKSLSLELSQPLYKGGRTENDVKSAESRVLAARARYTQMPWVFSLKPGPSSFPRGLAFCVPTVMPPRVCRMKQQERTSQWRRILRPISSQTIYCRSNCAPANRSLRTALRRIA